MKKLLLTLCLTIISFNCYSQDMIVKKDGSIIQAKVSEIGTTEVKYKKWSNQDGPMYTISKSDVLAITYQNGEKEKFNEELTSSSETNPKLIIKAPHDNNLDIVKSYNNYLTTTTKLKPSKRNAKSCFIVFGVDESSLMSNDEIEITFERTFFKSPARHIEDYYIYNIRLKNKTDKTIYIDKANCFRTFGLGTSHCYYENSEIKSISIGGGNGISANLGAVAGGIGIGGVAGKIAGGINIGGGSSHSITTTFDNQRVIAIPAKGQRNLTDEKWAKSSNGVLLSGPDYTIVEEAENFVLENGELNLTKGDILSGQVVKYNNKNTPLRCEYLITYSLDEDFSTYSTLTARLYVLEFIGYSQCPIYSKKIEECLDGLNTHSIVGYTEFR